MCVCMCVTEGGVGGSSETGEEERKCVEGEREREKERERERER